ncbi:MAG: hypothetical protein AAF604_19015 [Acidobacteriota bacterium]
MRPLLLLASFLLVPAAGAQPLPECHPPARYVAWPEADPVWQLCIQRPKDGGGATGSGLELQQVFFRGRPVLARAQTPDLAVRHLEDPESPLCSGRCFTTWSRQELAFGIDGERSQGWFETARPVVTTCDRARPQSFAGNCPWGEPWACQSGVALEAGADRLQLTSEVGAGWSRYTLRWVLHRDGRIEALVGALSEGRSCARTPHHHEVTWRFDFDLGGLRRDEVSGPDGLPYRTAGRRSRQLDGDAGWQIRDPKSGRGYRLVPGAADLPFPPGELLVTTYGDPAPAGSCAEEGFGDVVGRALAGEDPVLWYRARAFVDSDAPYRCAWLGPTLLPTGHWGQAADQLLFADGFESGDTSAWSARQPAP